MVFFMVKGIPLIRAHPKMDGNELRVDILLYHELHYRSKLYGFVSLFFKAAKPRYIESRSDCIEGRISMKALWIVFFSVFIAELGDKTQLATLTFSTDRQLNKWGIFAASSLALILSSLLAVLVGSQLSHWINPRILKLIAGLGFIAIGIFTLWSVRY
jgi:putative Ca2+/H+ antiporter (TMEM165/GDT1 family)